MLEAADLTAPPIARIALPHVVPLGFPQQMAFSGRVSDRATTHFDLGAAIPGTGKLTVKLYPSPVATLTRAGKTAAAIC